MLTTDDHRTSVLSQVGNYPLEALPGKPSPPPTLAKQENQPLRIDPTDLEFLAAYGRGERLSRSHACPDCRFNWTLGHDDGAYAFAYLAGFGHALLRQWLMMPLYTQGPVAGRQSRSS